MGGKENGNRDNELTLRHYDDADFVNIYKFVPFTHPNIILTFSRTPYKSLRTLTPLTYGLMTITLTSSPL